MMHLFAGEFAEAIAASQEGVRLSREIGNEWNEAFAQTWVGEAYIEKGEIETAERVMVAAIELGARAFPPTLVATRSDLARLYTDLGDAPRGIALSELALRVAEERFPPMRPVATSALIHAYLAAGLLERAREIEPDSAELLDLDANPMYATDGIRGQIELAYAEHAFVRVLDLCDLFREFCERSSLKQYAPELLRVQAQTLAQLGEWDAAAKALAQARAMAEQMAARWSLWQILAVSSRLEQARGFLEKAEAYRTQGRAWIAEIAARTPKEYRARFVERAHRSF
jgi:tetratricopeptide (TPR) repeat protein